MAATITLLQAASNTADQSTYTFSSQNLGSSSSDRYIAVCIGSRIGSLTSILVSSVSIAGFSATIVANVHNAQTNAGCVSCIAIAKVPSGTTGDVVVTFPTTVVRCGIVLFSLLGINSETPFEALTSTSSPSTANLDIPEDGVALGCCVCGANVSSASWSGLTERSDSHVESLLTVTSASDAFASQQIDRSISCTYSPTPTGNAAPTGTFVSWSPSGSFRRYPVVNINGGADYFNGGADQ